MPECTLLNLLLAKLEKGNFTLPTLPDIAIQMMTISDDDSASSADLVSAIQKDGGISVRLIRLANSVHFKRRQSVDHVHQAVVRIGFNQTKSLVVAMAMEQLFISNDSFIQYRLKEAWQNSIHIASHSIALNFVQEKGRDANTLLLLGTVCRIGMLALLCELERCYNKSVYADVDTGNLKVVERDIITSMIRVWEFPKVIQSTLEEFYLEKPSRLSDYLRWADNFKEDSSLVQLPNDQQVLYKAKQAEIQAIFS